MAKHHENYKELIWVLAKTDFKLRYHDSILGYVWALLKPLLMFLVLNFVFSSIFNLRNIGIEHYSLQLLVAIMLFNFFAEGTVAGMSSLLSKSQLVTKIYVPRWAIIIASTINSALVYLTSLIIIVLFFVWYGFMPSAEAIILFLFSSLFIYALIVIFSQIAAPLYIKFRDLSMIWDVVIMILFYASPIIYPLTMLPENIQRILLISPIAFIIHFTKESLAYNHFPDLWQMIAFVIMIVAGFIISIFVYRKLIPNIAEEI